MEKKKFDHFKLLWLYSILFTTIIILIFMISAGCTPFGNYSMLNYDAFHQFMAFCSEIRRKVLSGESLFYSWNIGMGMNFGAVIAVILNSPFNILLLLFSNEDICISVSLIILLKIILSSGAMGYFLTKHLERIDNTKYRSLGNGLLIIAFSIAYATSGYVCGYYWNFMWLDVILILPLVILGMDRLIYDGKPILYILALFYSINCSYYLSIMVCIFLVLYFFTYKYNSVKDFFMKGLVFAGASILAAGMAALIIVIAYKNIIYSNTSKDSLPAFGWFGNIFFILKSHYYLSIPIISQPYDGDANLYCGVICIVSAFIYPLVKKLSLRERISKILITAFLLVSMNNTVLNYIWHGFHDQKGVPNRFSFLYIFIIMLMAFDVVILIEKENIRKFILSGIVAAFFPIVIYFFNDYNGFVSSKTMLIIAIGMSLIYTVVLIVRMFDEKTYKLTTYIVAILVALESASAAFITLKYNELNDTGYYMAYINGRKPAVDYVRGLENDSFYREEISDNIIDNESIFHGMKGYSLFSSVVSSDMEMTMRNLGVKNQDISFYYTNSNPFLDDIFGIKYIHSLTEDSELALRDEKIYDDGNNAVYYNADALPVGFGVSSNIKNIDLSKTGNATFNQNLFASEAAGVEGVFESKNNVSEVFSQELQIAWDENSNSIKILGAATEELPDIVTLYAAYDIAESGDYYFNCDFHYLYYVSIAIGDEIISENENANQSIHVGQLEAGERLVAIIEIPLAFVSDVPIYLSKYNADKEKKSVSALSAHSFQIESYTGNTLKGSIDLDNDQMLFMSIPYDKGWNVYVDGKKTEITKVYGSFIGIDMNPGKHEVMLKYVSEGFYAGLIISMIAWAVFILIVIFQKKKDKVERGIAEDSADA